MSNVEILKSMGRMVPSAQRSYDALVANKNIPEWQREALVGKMLDKKVPKAGPSGLGLMAVTGMNEAQKKYDEKKAAIEEKTRQQKLAASVAAPGDPLGKLAGGVMRLGEYVSSPLATASGIIQKGLLPARQEQQSTDVQELNQQAGMARTALPLTVGLATAPLSMTASAVATGIAGAVGRGLEETANSVTGKDDESVLSRVGQSLGEGAIAGATDLAAGKILRVAGKVGKQIFSPVAKQVDSIISKGIQAIRPSTAGKKVAGDLAKFDEQATLAIRTILDPERKKSFVYTDGGEGLPKNLRQFSEAIEKTREQVFLEYDTLAKQAGEQGAVIDLNNVVKEVADTISDPKYASWEDQNPELSDYLLKRLGALEKRGFYTAEQAQQAVKNYNNSLQAFYQRPEYDTYAKANIDAMIANNMRKALDESIESAAGPGYADLKKAYGALKSIEADVVKRSIVDARKNAKGLLDFSDIYTGSEMLSGLLTFNPAQFAKGAAGVGIKKYLQALNDPNRAISRMFKQADALLNTVAE